MLLYGVARLLIERGWIDRDFVSAHTTGYEAFARQVRPFTVERVARECDLSPRAIEELARLVGRGERVSFWWTMGVNQGHQAVRTAEAIVALALLTGSIGRPGTGANSITGQANAMGSRLFSNTTCLLGGRDFGDAGHRREVARILGIDAALIPEESGLAYDGILDGVAAGRIKGLWVIATNPAHSWIGRSGLEAALDRLDLLVVQDLYPTTETARRADLFLPAAGAGEKDGTVINSERRIGLWRAVARPPGEALPDFEIFRRVAERWGCGDLVREWTSPEAAFQILKRLSRGRPCDFSGIPGYAEIERAGGIQWPYPERAEEAGEEGGEGAGEGAGKGAGEEAAEGAGEGAAEGGAERAPAAAGRACGRAGASAAGGVAAEAASGTERRLFEDGRFFHPDGRARLCFEAPRPLPEPPDAEYPLLLVTGRGSSAQWHTNTRTAKSAVLRKLYPAEAHLEMSEADAAALGVAAGDLVRLESRRGAAVVRARVVAAARPGEVFLEMHDAQTNLLTLPVFDPLSRQPAYKACAVRVRRLARGR